MDDTDTVNFECDSVGSASSYTGNCYNLELIASNANNVSIICTEYYDCRSAVFRVENVLQNATIIGDG